MRYDYLKVFHFGFIFLLIVNSLSAQEIIEVRAGFDRIPLNGNLSYSIDPTNRQSFEFIRKHFQGTEIKDSYPNFGNSPYAHWLYFRIRNYEQKSQNVELITKGIDSLQIYITSQDSLAYSFPNSGGHRPIFRRKTVSPLLIAPFTMMPLTTYGVWVRIRNVHYRLAASPFDLYEQEAGARFLFQKHFLYSLFIGSMFLILLFSIGLVYYFNEKIYWYYLGCVCCALSIMLIYNDYFYLLIDRAPWFILNKNALGVLSASVPVFYLLFAEKFLEIRHKEHTQIFLISRGVILLQYLAMAVIILAGEALFDYKVMFYPPMFILSSTTLYYLAKKIRTPQGKLFLLATVPVTITVILETFSDLHQIPVQSIHDSYYATTLTEVLLLTAGIVYRFRKNEEAKFGLEKEIFVLESEILAIEVKAKNEVTEEIADKLHNDVSADLALTKSKLSFIQEKAAPHTELKDWLFVFERLNSAANWVRDLSHQLSESHTNRSIISMLLNRFYGESKVEIDYKGLKKSEIVDSKTETILFSLVSELITNAIKHAQCTSIFVQLNYAEPELVILIEDNGVGFDPEKVVNKGHGLKSIENTIIQKLKGTFSIESTPSGTVVIIKTNLNQENR